MAFLYHGVPEKMKGHHLISLNEMFKTHQDLHDQYLEKYKGREEILERTIPLLGCVWNDVVQLLPLHPQKLFELQKESGLIESIPNYSYFRIDSDELDADSTVVYFKTAPGEENVIVKWLKDVNLDELQNIPQPTMDYYKSSIGKKEPIFNYQFVPHVVFKGKIDISNSEIIRLH